MATHERVGAAHSNAQLLPTHARDEDQAALASSRARRPLCELLSTVALCGGCLVCLVGTRAGAQDSGNEGAFASVELQATRVNEGFGAVLGLLAGWETRTGYRVGGTFYDLLNGTPLPEPDAQGQRLHTKMHYGGLLLGKSFQLGPVSLGGDLLAGIGNVSSYRGEKNQDSQNSLYLVAYPALTFRPPDLGLFRTQLAAGYRWTVPVRDGGTDAGIALAGPAVSLTVSIARLWAPSRDAAQPR